MKYAKSIKMLMCLTLTTGLALAAVAAGKGSGYMGGDGVMTGGSKGGGGTGTGTGDGTGGGTGTGTGGGTEGGGSQPGDVSGPTGDQGSIQGKLYGDLYVVLRYQGGETKRVPKVDASGNPVLVATPWTDPDGNLHTVKQQGWVTATAIGGEPILTENFVAYQVVAEDTQLPVICPETGNYWWPAPTPSQCVQPVASFNRWGDLSSDANANHPYHSVLEKVRFNTIPLVMTYDPTWGRTEFSVGTLKADGTLDSYFIQPGGWWADPVNGLVTYTDGVLWTGLIQEVSFGRLNQARATEAVLQSAFDEAINSINQALAIRIDPSGRILLRQYVYDEYRVDPSTGNPLITGEIDKPIDSPLENLAIYLKLMRDGHLVTPGDQRSTIDRSMNGGIPLEQLLGLEDGPSKELRPTINIAKLRAWGLGYLVDVSEVNYYTYYDANYVLQATTIQPAGVEGVDYQKWVGIPTANGSVPTGADFETCAATLAAAADKGGKLTVDHVVYLNSILGINNVVGTVTNANGTIVDYAKNPRYFSYGAAPTYDRTAVFSTRGYYPANQVPSPGGDPITGKVLILALPAGAGGDPASGVWVEYPASILDYVSFRELGVNDQRFPNGTTATLDIGGFSQAADDNLSLIDFVHTYQIPANR